MIQPTYQQFSMVPQRRRYVCPVCGDGKVIEVRPIEKHIVICAHPDSRGGTLPVIAMREEGELLH